jgi:hypothetical protein
MTSPHQNGLSRDEIRTLRDNLEARRKIGRQRAKLRTEELLRDFEGKLAAEFDPVDLNLQEP